MHRKGCAKPRRLRREARPRPGHAGTYACLYQDFNLERAQGLLRDLGIDENSRFKKLSKGNKEKVQLILVMSRDARLYVLDEPIGGVDPAARDYILNTIIITSLTYLYQNDYPL